MEQHQQIKEYYECNICGIRSDKLPSESYKIEIRASTSQLGQDGRNIQGCQNYVYRTCNDCGSAVKAFIDLKIEVKESDR